MVVQDGASLLQGLNVERNYAQRCVQPEAVPALFFGPTFTCGWATCARLLAAVTSRRDKFNSSVHDEHILVVSAGAGSGRERSDAEPPLDHSDPLPAGSRGRAVAAAAHPHAGATPKSPIVRATTMALPSRCRRPPGGHSDGAGCWSIRRSCWLSRPPRLRHSARAQRRLGNALHCAASVSVVHLATRLRIQLRSES